ncbi:MAG: PAS domain-containing sensor histidine kinase, partial [Methanobacterium sp.]
YRQLVENAQEGICSSDLEGTITFVNPRMAEMFGYTTSTMQGKSIFSFIKENQIEKVQKYLKSPNDTLKGHFDFEFIKKDGKKIFTSIETSIIRDENGNKKGILALVADISRGKKAENRLKENEEYLKTIFATVQTGIIVIDSKSKEIIDVNKAASNLIGLSRDEIIGKVCHRFICPHEEGDCPITDLNQRVDNSQRVLLTANNEEIPIIKNVVYTNLKGRKCVLESFIDISKLKKLEESLKESKEWYKALIEASPEAIIAMDRDGVINFASSKSLELFGFEKIHHLLNKNMLELMAPECHKKVESDMLKIMDGEYTQNLEYKFMKSNGTIFTGEVNLSVIKDNKGVSQSIIFILRDITEIKNAEKQIKASLKEKEVLLREIHHRVKNNLQIISSLLSLQSGYLLDDEAQDIFTESQNRIRTMAMIHEKLYKSESLVKINFKDYINDLTENLFYNYKISPNMIKLYNNIEDLSFDINTAIPCGLIINELVTNCIKHAFPWFKTPMSLKESSEDLEFGKYKIEIQLHLDNGNYVLSVADNGVGIPDDFDFNETNSLGLKLVNNLVEQLDGTMTLDNTSGSKFTIVFKENNYQERI